MDRSRTPSLARRALAAVGVLFGVATLVAGLRVLAGADPGYVVFRPLLVFNAAMGVAYVIAGVLAWRSLRAGMVAAAMIALVNALVLGAVAVLYAVGSAVAFESLRAMMLRTVVWLAIFGALLWLERAAWARDALRAGPAGNAR